MVFRQKSECVVTTPGWKHGGDQRETIGRARHIAICQPGARERGCGVEQAARAAFGDSQRRAIGVNAKRLDVLSFQHRQSAGRAKMAAVVGRIQLAAKPHVPAVCGVEPRNAVHHTFEDAQVGLGAQLGYDECVSAGCFDERGRQRYRMRRAVAAIGNRLELGRIVDAETAGNAARGLSYSRCADQEANAPVNRKDRAPIVEPADGIDVRAAQKRAPQRC